MKGLIAIPIVIGSVLLIGGGALFGYAAYKSSKNNTVETKEYKELASFNKFDIDLTIADLEFVKSEETKVVVQETKYDVHTVTSENNTLKVKGQDIRKWYEHLFNWNWFQKVKVTVYMPEGAYDELKVISATGNVTIPSDFSFASFTTAVSTGNVNSRANVTGDITVTVSTGKINFENITANRMDLKASTGDIRLKDVAVTEDIKIKTSTGDFNLENVTCKSYESGSSTGDLNFNNVKVTNTINVKNDTGHVKMIASDAEELDIKTSTGYVKLELLTSKIVYAESSTGKKNVPTSTTGGLCKIKTSTGDITVKFAE